MQPPQDIHSFLAQHETKELLRFVAVGSVDDGKSTLIGRLLHDTGQVYHDQLDDARKQSADGEIDFALLTDGLRAEREQGITIDVAYRYFSTERRKFIIADTPGHVQYTRNMATGASTANAAIILIDARLGVLPQTKRHAYIASLLGIPHLIACINKMDLVSYDQATYQSIQQDVRQFTETFRFKDITFFPISALKGDNIVEASDNTPWYQGPTLLEHLETVPVSYDRNLEDFRFPVQYVLRPHLDYRAFAGSIASGIVKPGDEIMVLPSQKRSRIKAIDTYEGEIPEAYTPMSVALRLEDEIDISRGDILVHPHNPTHTSRSLHATLVWMSEHPLDPARAYLIKHTTRITRVNIDQIHWKLDPETLAHVPAQSLALNDIGNVDITAHRPVHFDPYHTNRETGAFIVLDALSNNTVAAGVLLPPTQSSAPSDDTDASPSSLSSSITTAQREARLHQKGATLWLSGLPASGKSTLAFALEENLFIQGHFVHVIDENSTIAQLDEETLDDHVWAPSSLNTSVRTARTLNELGILTICTTNIPQEAQRRSIEQLLDAQRIFHVHLDAPYELCKQRIQQEASHTQRLAQLEHQHTNQQPPQAPHITLPHSLSTSQAVSRIVQFLRQHNLLEPSS